MKIKELAVNGLFSDGDWVESKDQDPEGEKETRSQPGN